ncbi:related to PCL7 - cyclin like protein interacting with Pho85p [Cephalotrichum gorgonifer]|uniref:Related to PCL7 - cyclin like protein interacting with Pho85p n=1 Tax=Cephalotrichum gorgonifer TaxID=2041049 RepID=A0AAE8SQV7_9PEZI|nr:related to PCL7 - cyclin like protein interacting with Pho85p [Cephalotrichum gorgonifer]
MTRQHQHSPDSSQYVSGHPAGFEPQTQPSPRYTSSHTSTRPISDRQETLRDPAKPISGLHRSATGGASRFPSPPSSSSPSTDSLPSHSQNALPDAHMPPVAPDLSSGSSSTTVVAMPPTATSSTPPRGQQPSPSSDGGFTVGTSYNNVGIVAENPQDDDPLKSPPQGRVIHIKDLGHIQSLVRADLLSGTEAGILNDTHLQQMKYDISGMPITDVIEMVAALLTKITSTNDLQHDAIQRNATHQQQASQNTESGSASNMSPLSTSVLAFHGKNVPAITILSYLSRIHRYCPTTYEVFLSLLVYFDRMTERVNDRVMKHEEARKSDEACPSQSSQSHPQHQRQHTVDTDMKDDSSGSAESDSDLADDDDDDEMEDSEPPRREFERIPAGSATYFVVDSFNIHRLIISGVTCASKFFSDVFYTNSRYAKVGGLPLAELNHLELQFLLLNDFRLFVPVEDLDAYATMLVEFYAREIVSEKSRSDDGE